jgi:sugar transferase EpsL
MKVSSEMLKRSLDLAVALALLIGLSPLLALLSLALRWKLGRPVLFAQTRPGLNGAPFEFYKFRTMTEARNAAGELLPDAARLTRFGELMRKSSLDELPQLVNVVKGDMSLVGPRPLLMEYLPLYSERQAQRHAVRPGITGWAQVNGRNALDWEQRFELDLWYVEHRSFWLDLRIIAMTAWRMLRPQGIAQPGHATMTKFTGSQRGR